MKRTSWCAVAALLALAVVASGATPAQAAADPAAAPAATAVRYVALGDSFTAAPMVPVTDPAAGCQRSSNNYPHQVAGALAGQGRLASFTDVSCSGATTDHVFTAQNPGAVGPQLDALANDTTLVTIGLGGNDEALFSTLISTCITLSLFDAGGKPCTDYFTSLGVLSPEWITQRTTWRLVNVVNAVRAKAPHARIVLVGYPVLTPAQGTCESLPIADGDYPYVRQVNSTLSAAINQAANQTRVDYLDVATASQGHDVCASQPWVNGFLDDPQRAQAFHPFFEGQQAVAQLLLSRAD